MSEKTFTKNKHMILDDRMEIQECLNRGLTFKAIAKRIGKDQTTVSKEVKKHLVVNPSPVKHFKSDKTTNPICPNLIKAPFVCNPCKKRHTYCAFQKQLYNAKSAQKEYEKLLIEAREGIPLNKESFYEIDGIIASGIRKGQHLYHILQTNNLKTSKSSVYRHLHKGYLSISKIDFPRVVKFKPRKRILGDYIPKAAKIGRTFDDFLSFITESNITTWVEMDTVIGHVGGKTIVTFDFTLCNFMFGLLLDDKSATEVSKKISALKLLFKNNNCRFGDVFPLILTDNGGEFANVSVIENDDQGLKESAIFFCDPMQSSQKPYVEKNHTLFRDIVPKGQSFDTFSQNTVNLIFSHINSVKRKIYNGKSPYEIFSFTFSENISNILGVSSIPAQDVIQSPKLLLK